MRILITMTGSWGTGSGTVVEALVRGFVARGHEVCVLHPENAAGDGEASEGASGDGPARAPEARHEVWHFPIEGDGVRLEHFPLMIPDPNPHAPADARTYADLSPAEHALFDASFDVRLREVIDRFRPDVIECQHVWRMAAVVAEAGLPFAAMAHHSDQMAFEQDPSGRPAALRTARAAWGLFALTETARDEVVRLYGVPPERVTVMGNGYDRTVFRPVEADRADVLARLGLGGIPPDAPLVSFAGKLSRTKGVDVILEANRLLGETMAAPPHLLLFGTGRLDDVLDATRLAAYDTERCHFLGHRPYEVVRDVHNVSRCSLMPSRTEGFGLAALEAMGCGCPVVVSRLGGLDRYTVGAVVEPGDAAALAEAIRALVEMPEEAHARLRAEAVAAAEGFSWDEIIERRLAHYAAAPPMPDRPRPRASRATAADVAPLRTAVLRPSWRDRLATYPEDDQPVALHLAARDDAKSVVAVGTIYPEAPPTALRGVIPEAAWVPGAAWRLRGMASAPEVRGGGYGAAVLAGCFREIADAGGTHLWCNARVGAVPFYERMGLTAVGEVFDIPEIGPHYVMWAEVSGRSQG